MQGRCKVAHGLKINNPTRCPRKTAAHLAPTITRRESFTARIRHTRPRFWDSWPVHAPVRRVPLVSVFTSHPRKELSSFQCEDGLIAPIQSRSISDSRTNQQIVLSSKSKLTRKPKSQQSPISPSSAKKLKLYITKR